MYVMGEIVGYGIIVGVAIIFLALVGVASRSLWGNRKGGDR